MALEAHESPDGLISPAESPPLISAVAGARPWKLCLATPIFPGPQPVLSGPREATSRVIPTESPPRPKPAGQLWPGPGGGRFDPVRSALG